MSSTGLASSGHFLRRHSHCAARVARCLLAAWVLTTPGRAADFARLVPDDVGLCIESDRLMEVGGEFRHSALYQRLDAVPRLKEIVSGVYEQPLAIGQRLAARFDVTDEEFSRQFVNGHALLAVWPDDIRDFETSRLLMILEARSNKIAEQMLDVLEQDISRKAAARPQNVTHAGKPYFVARLVQDKVPFHVCLAALDNMILLSSNESILQRSLELSCQLPDGEGSLRRREAYRHGMARVHADAPVRVFVNPRPWDAVVLKRLPAGNTKTEEQIFFEVLSELWRAADYWVSEVHVSPVFRLSSFLHFDSAKLPEPLRDVGRSFAGPSDYFRQVPADAALAFAGRIDVAHVMNLLLQSRTPEQMKQIEAFREVARGVFMGLDLFDDVLPMIGPDGGFYMTPANDEAQGGQSPVAWVGAAQLRPQTDKNRAADVILALDGALRTAMQLGASMQNAETPEPTAEVEFSRKNGISIASLRGLNVLPPQVALSYAFVDDYLLTATCDKALANRIELDPASSLAASPRFHMFREQVQGAGQVLYMNCGAIRKAVAEHGPFIVEVLRHIRNEPAEEVAKKIKSFAQLAELGETIVLADRIEDDGVSFSLAISTDRPAD
jgi:hypothetical protein